MSRKQAVIFAWKMHAVFPRQPLLDLKRAFYRIRMSRKEKRYGLHCACTVQ